jgi:hypothetical protein
MLVSLVLISVLAAPRAPADAEVVAFVPRLDATAQLLPFFSAAGTRSVLLRPESWRADAFPLIDVDVTNPEELTRVGIDATGSLTRSRLGDVAVSCLHVLEIDAFRKACDAKLARLGEVFEKVEGGVSIYATRDSLGRVLAAYTLLGHDSCAIIGHGRSVESMFAPVARAMSKAPTGPGYGIAAKTPGVMQIIGPTGSPHGAMGISAKGLQLTLDARIKNAPFAQFAGAGLSPFGVFSASGIAVIRGRLAKAQLPSLIDQVVLQLPGAATLSPVAKLVSPYVTGNTALLLSHVRVTTGLRTREARFFALRSALLVEISDPEAVRALLANLDPKALAFREGTLSVTLEGSVLVLSNDAEVRAKALSALAKSAGKQGHGLEFDVDPKLLAKGLQQVPLLEAVQSPELAGLVAASTELGPLLLATERVTGWLDGSGGTHTAKLLWDLDAAKFTPDAGH